MIKKYLDGLNNINNEIKNEEPSIGHVIKYLLNKSSLFKNYFDLNSKIENG
jgi:hypothetical protein